MDLENRLVVARGEREGVGGIGSLGLLDATWNGFTMRSCWVALRTMSRYLYRNRTKGGKKMYTCKCNLVPMLYSGKKINKKNVWKLLFYRAKCNGAWQLTAVWSKRQSIHLTRLIRKNVQEWLDRRTRDMLIVFQLNIHISSSLCIREKYALTGARCPGMENRDSVSIRQQRPEGGAGLCQVLHWPVMKVLTNHPLLLARIPKPGENSKAC